jgi:N-acetylmuramoyl-L-alanine amidase
LLKEHMRKLQVPKILDDAGKIVNVSQKKADDIASTRAQKALSDNSATATEKLKNSASIAATSISTKNLDATADKAIATFTDAEASVGGQVAGAIEGGMENLTAKADGYKQELTDAKDTVTGLLNGGTTSLENMSTDMINGAIAGLASKFGTKVQIEYETDAVTGITIPVTTSLEADPTSGAISGLLTIITGLGAELDPAKLAESFKGELQNIVTDVSPSGLLSAGKDLAEGKIGAFTSDSISALASQAITSVTKDIRSTVGSALAGAANLNKVVNYTTIVDLGGGNYDSAVSTVTGVVGGTGSIFETDSANFNQAMKYVDSDGRADIASRITKDNEIVQNLETAKKDLSTLSGGKDGATVLAATQQQVAARAEYNSNASEYKTIVKTRVGKGSETGIIQGLSTDTLTDVKKQIKGFASGITDENVEKIIVLSQGDAADESEAIRILTDASGKSFDVIVAFLKTIDTTIYNATKPALTGVVFEAPYEIGSFQKAWDKGLNDPVFPYVSSVEELEAEIRNISREIIDVIVHWTETHTNKNIGSEEINAWHLKAGLDGIGYHYVCRRDGSLQRGRPVNIEGQHTPGLDAESIGFVFVGGINAPTGTPNASNFLSAQSLTRSQLNTFDHFCRANYKTQPGIKIVGHNDVDVSGLNVDPGFDVTDYVRTRFGKENS